MPEPVLDAATEVEDWLASLLERNPELYAASGNRVFPNVIPQLESLPAIVYRRTGTTRDRHMTKASGEATARFTLSCMARQNSEGYKATLRMARAARLALDGFKGSDNRGHFIRRVFIDDEADDPEGLAVADGDAQLVYSRVLSVTVVYIEATRNNSGGS